MERYKWLTKHDSLSWDGKESFHALASKIITGVAKYSPNLTRDARVEEHFFRFRASLPKDFRDAIDMGCGPKDRTLEFAKDLATRVKMTMGTDDTKAVTFAGARLEDNRVSGLELTLVRFENKMDALSSDMGRRFEDMGTHLQTQDKRTAKLEKSVEEMQSYVYGRNFSQNRPSRSQSPRTFQTNFQPISPRPQFQPHSQPQTPGSSFGSQSPCMLQTQSFNPYPSNQQGWGQAQSQPQHQSQPQSNFRSQSERHNSGQHSGQSSGQS